MKKYYKYSLVLFFIIFFTCDDLVQTTKRDFKRYSIDVPNNWGKFELNGIDSKIQGFITDKGDTVFCSVGTNVMRFDETVQVFSKKQITKYDSLGLETSNLHYSKTPSIDEAQGTFLNQYYYYEDIGQLKAKFVLPKKIGTGFTAVSFDSIDEKSNRLIIYAENLDTISQFKLTKSFKSILIKK